YGAALAIDDAHSVGVLGPRGDGTAAHFGLVDEVDLIVGTFSKSLASIGGFAAGTENVIHFLKHHSRPLIFTAALPPGNTAGVLAALQVLQREPERRERLWKNARRLQDGLRSVGCRSKRRSCSGASCSTPACSPIRWFRLPCRHRCVGCAPA
ncbi:MAG: aminotransferase class I/II-fold pyridoxal phosphate-dependent enzyme, partial [Bacillati bacterium ANGP1]